MPSAKSIINLNVNIGGVTVKGATFNKLLTILPHVAYIERERSYVDLEGVGEDFANDHPAFLFAQAAFQQDSEAGALPVLKIGTQTVDQVVVTVDTAVDSGDSMIVTVSAGTGTHKFTLNTAVYTTTATTSLTIAAAIVAAINGGAEPVTAVDNLDGTFTLTADVPDTEYYASASSVMVFSTATYQTTIVDASFATTSDSTPTVEEIAANLVLAINTPGGQTARMGATDNADGTYDLDRDGGYTGGMYVAPSSNQSIGLTEPTGRTGITTVAPSPSETVLEAMQAITALNPDFFGVVPMDITDPVILDLAGAIQTQARIMGAASQDAVAIASGTTDIGSQLKALNYDQTFIDYDDDAGVFNDVRIMADGLPTQPGTRTWYGKDRVGQVALDIGSTAELNLQNKNINAYLEITNKDEAATFYGTMADGTFIDIIHFKYFLEDTLVTGLLSYVLSQPKIPYTDIGLSAFTTVITDLVKPMIEEDESLGVILDDPQGRTLIITIPLVADQSQADRTARIVRNIRVIGQYTNAAHTFDITVNIGI